MASLVAVLRLLAQRALVDTFDTIASPPPYAADPGPRSTSTFWILYAR